MKLFGLVFVFVLLIALSECSPVELLIRTKRQQNTTPSRPTTPKTTPSPRYLNCLANCPTTSEYNPVCGSNQIVYHNMGKFECGQMCGSGAKFIRRGNCAGLF